MQFLVLAYDARDADAPKRRMSAREAHLALISEYKAAGHMKMGAALLDNDGNMIGSSIIAEFDNRADLDAWLEKEPYLLQQVWGDVTVTPCQIAPSFR